MQGHFERRIRCTCRFGDKIGDSFQTIQINSKMEEFIPQAECKQRMGPCANRFTTQKRKRLRPSAIHVRTDPEWLFVERAPDGGRNITDFAGSAV